MTPNEYQKLAQRTSPAGHDRILNGTMGLIGESGEVVDAVKKWTFQTTKDTPFPKQKLIEEIGDVLWYVAEVCTGMDLQMGNLFQKKMYTGRDTPQEVALSIAGFAMRVRSESTYETKLYMMLLIGACKYMLEMYCDSTLEAAMEGNIEKLRKRYPDGFDPERSMNRAG